MTAQLSKKIANRRNRLARHCRLEVFERRIPSRADQQSVNLFRFRSRSRLVRRFQVERFTPTAPLNTSRPIFNLQYLPVSLVGQLENRIVPIARIGFRKTPLLCLATS